MGWADCGDDSLGRPIGYAFQGLCDHPGCGVLLERSLSYICGRDMHGDDEFSCERYFCEKHVQYAKIMGHDVWICAECWKIHEKEGTLQPETFE